MPPNLEGEPTLDEGQPHQQHGAWHPKETHHPVDVSGRFPVHEGNHSQRNVDRRHQEDVGNTPGRPYLTRKLIRRLEDASIHTVRFSQFRRAVALTTPVSDAIDAMKIARRLVLVAAFLGTPSAPVASCESLAALALPDSRDVFGS